MKIPVLMYHDIRSDRFEIASAPVEKRPYIQRASDFAEQMRCLAGKGVRGATLSGMGTAPAGEAEGVVLTFDDGDLSNFTDAAPCLLEYGHRATFFITTDFVGRPGYLDWSQVRELQRLGMEIGSHSMSHRAPATLDEASLFDELAGSRRILEDALGEPVLSFSLPTGFHHPSVERLARCAGYRFVANSKFGWFRPADPFDVRRIAIKRETGMRQFRGFVAGDPLVIYRKRAGEEVKAALVRHLGIGRYEKLRAFLIGHLG